MTITIPTVDDFTESTVMLVMREIVEYICGDNGLVAQINNNDITGFKSSYTNNILKIDATKGDGSTIPVCNVTIEGGGSSTGNPYPTGVSGTVGGDGNITFTITMSSGSPITTTINMNYFASADDLSDLQRRITGLKLTSSGNTMSINGTSAPIVNSISGSVSNGNLKISVNGIESVDIPLPKTSPIEINEYNATPFVVDVSSTSTRRAIVLNKDGFIDIIQNINNKLIVYKYNNNIIYIADYYETLPTVYGYNLEDNTRTEIENCIREIYNIIGGNFNFYITLMDNNSTDIYIPSKTNQSAQVEGKYVDGNITLPVYMYVSNTAVETVTKYSIIPVPSR